LNKVCKNLNSTLLLQYFETKESSFLILLSELVSLKKIPLLLDDLEEKLNFEKLDGKTSLSFSSLLCLSRAVEKENSAKTVGQNLSTLLFCVSCESDEIRLSSLHLLKQLGFSERLKLANYSEKDLKKLVDEILLGISCRENFESLKILEVLVTFTGQIFSIQYFEHKSIVEFREAC